MKNRTTELYHFFLLCRIIIHVKPYFFLNDLPLSSFFKPPFLSWLDPESKGLFLFLFRIKGNIIFM